MQNTPPRRNHHRWQPGPVRAADGSLWLRVGVSHLDWITQRQYRKRVLRGVAAVLRHLPAYVDFRIECCADGACCRIEGLDKTCQRLEEALQDWIGGQSVGSIDRRAYDALRAAGQRIFLADGTEMP